MKTRTKTAPRRASAPAAAATAAVAAPESATLANLQTAYNGETNAQGRYLAFAREADEEGYAPVVSLFRAAARAEEIHAGNHAEAIRHLGARPKASAEAVIVQSTRENLEAAVKGESYERDEMYPAFLHQARSDGIPSAARTFHLAKKAETEHAALFSLTLHELERLRGDSVVYYVCPVCGFTSSKADGTRCPVCATPVNRFEKVS
jgi:rubrerythrin